MMFLYIFYVFFIAIITSEHIYLMKICFSGHTDDVFYLMELFLTSSTVHIHTDRELF